MTAPPLRGFPPVVDDRARLLILGSFPSAQSLAERQYYANPRNAFWSITGTLLGFDDEAPYEERLAALRARRVALWDVLHRCRRIGSSDARIDSKTMVVNDFAGLFGRYPGIRRVYFNGAKAAQVFHRLVDPDRMLDCHRLPSTSPAHTLTAADKLAAWRVITRS